MNTTKRLPAKSLQDFIEDYVKGEPLTVNTITWAIRQYIYMNYEPTGTDKLQMYEAIFHMLADLLNQNKLEEVQKLLTNIRNWAKAREGSQQEEDAYRALAIENETFYNLPKLG